MDTENCCYMLNFNNFHILIDESILIIAIGIRVCKTTEDN